MLKITFCIILFLFKLLLRFRKSYFTNGTNGWNVARELKIKNNWAGKKRSAAAVVITESIWKSSQWKTPHKNLIIILTCFVRNAKKSVAFRSSFQINTRWEFETLITFSKRRELILDNNSLNGVKKNEWNKTFIFSFAF